MRCLSLWQPWASLWLSPWKIHETRDWELHHRGWLLVQSAKKVVADSDIGEWVHRITENEFGRDWRKTLPLGAIIGAVHIDDVRSTAVILQDWKGKPDSSSPHWPDYQCGNFAPRRFGFRRAADYRIFKEPIPYRGQQGPFDVPDDVVRAAFDTAVRSVAPPEVVL